MEEKTSQTITLSISSNVLSGGNISQVSSRINKNFELSLLISQLKQKLERIVGTAPENQHLQLINESTLEVFAELSDNEATLGSYHPSSGMILYVIDQDPNSLVKQLQDTSRVPKFTISEEKYSQRENNIKKIKENMLKQKLQKEDTFPDHIKIGDRCEIDSNNTKRRGTVAYIGTLEGKPGYWIGVKLDQPLGKNDGSFEGRRYFQCPPLYGSFVKPSTLQVGDFPPFSETTQTENQQQEI